jgi:SNF2 family DNA or RNA helicase
MSNELKANFTCPECRSPLTCNALNITSVDMILKKKETETETVTIEKVQEKNVDNVNNVNKELTAIEKKLGVEWKINCINKYGSKMAMLVEYLYKIFENKENRVIIFSQYEKMLRLIGVTLEEFKIKFVYCCGNNYVLNRNINKFKKDDSYRVIMLSSENSNSGTNLTESNYIIFIDVLFDNIEKVKAMEAQAIARSLRIGQSRPVKVVRFITTNTVESEYFNKNKYDMSILQN